MTAGNSRTRFRTDLQALSVVGDLMGHARRRLERHIERCDDEEMAKATVTMQFTEVDLIPGSRAKGLKLTKKAKDDGRLASTITYEGGVTWSNGTMQIPGMTLPEMVRMSAIGCRLGDLVTGAPFPDMEVRKVAGVRNGQDISIRCRTKGYDVLDTDLIEGPEITMAEAERRAGHLRDEMVDAFTAYVLGTMDRRDALTLLVHMSQREHGQQEMLPPRYQDLLDGPMPEYLRAAGGESHSGWMRLQKLTVGFRTHVWMPGIMISDGYFYMHESRHGTMTLRQALGMDIGCEFGQATKAMSDGRAGTMMGKMRSIGEVMGI